MKFELCQTELSLGTWEGLRTFRVGGLQGNCRPLRNGQKCVISSRLVGPMRSYRC